MDDKTRNAAMAALMEMTISYPVYGVAAFVCGVAKIIGILDPGHAERIAAHNESDDDAKAALVDAEYLKYAGRTLDEGLAEFDAAVRKLPMADSRFVFVEPK